MKKLDDNGELDIKDNKYTIERGLVNHCKENRDDKKAITATKYNKISKKGSMKMNKGYDMANPIQKKLVWAQ